MSLVEAGTGRRTSARGRPGGALAAVGVCAVHGGTRCSIGAPQAFFSHRRSTQQGSGRTGRIATLVWRA
ncbi:laccase domain-containing protein [Luteimonas sp. e5]